MYDNVTKILLRYFQTKNTDYAVLLNGSWGCGKTYYVDKILRPEIEKQNGKLLYVSLHGVSNNDQVGLQIACALIAGKTARPIYEITSAFSISSVLSAFGDKWWVKLWPTLVATFGKLKWWGKIPALDKDRSFIVIDDLERAAGERELHCILGWVYESFIKHGFHVLLVCDETQKKDDALYHKSKEKYVRRTIDLTAGEHGLLVEFAKSRCAVRKGLYDSIEGSYLKFVEGLRVENLRTVAMLLDGLVELLGEVDSDFANKYAQLMFECTAPVFHAMATGLIGTDDLADDPWYRSLQSVRCFYATEEKRQDAEGGLLKACHFVDKYDSLFGHNYVVFPSVIEFVLTGNLNAGRIMAEVRKKFENGGSPEQIAYGQLQSYHVMEEGPLLQVMQVVVVGLEKGAYTLEDIVNICMRFVGIKKDLYVSSWPYDEDITKMFLRYADIRIGMQHEVPSEEELTEIRLRRRHLSSSESIVQPLMEHINQYYESLVEKADRDSVSGLFEALQKGDFSRAASCAEGRCGDHKVFRELAKYGCFADVSKLSVAGLDFLRGQAHLHIRRISNAGDFGSDQVFPLRDLATYLRSSAEADSTLAPSRKRRLIEAADEFDATWKHIVRTMGEGTRKAFVQKYGEPAELLITSVVGQDGQLDTGML